ncbi:MAG: ABC transporter substrate-binding protein [Hungatella sp.]|nr:ABC transporter substrate-binding protein [Hungatella sp.]
MRRKIAWPGLCFLAILFLVSCQAKGRQGKEEARKISPELTYTHSMDLAYAKQFSVDYYEGGYALLTIEEDEDRFLIIPEGAPVPGGLKPDIVSLRQPVENIYLVASAVMDMFVAMDSLASIRFSGTKPDGWYIEEARRAMDEGEILYAGNYSAPDYERILAEHCGLAVENTMIYHSPEVKEQLERFEIPVLVDHSSYEEEPLGRTEWVKCYGLLTGNEEKAMEAFRVQEEAFQTVEATGTKSGKSVAFFYVTGGGAVNVRKPSDYLAKMIRLAGGTYLAPGGSGKESGGSSMTVQMEEFYQTAKEADYLIYNSAVDSELGSLEELLEKNRLLGNFRAVQEGNVYCTAKNLYQSSMELGVIISDLHKILTQKGEELVYFYPLT